MSQRKLFEWTAELFDKETDTIGLHIRNIYKEGELSRKGTAEESSVVQNEGGRQVRRKVNFYKMKKTQHPPHWLKINFKKRSTIWKKQIELSKFDDELRHYADMKIL